MSTATTAIVEINDNGEIKVPPHRLAHPIRRAATWRIANACEHLHHAEDVRGDGEAWDDFARLIANVESAIALLNAIGYPGDDPTHWSVNAPMADLVSDAACDQGHLVERLVEERAAAAVIAEAAAVAADLETMAAQIRDAAADHDDDREVA